MEDKIQKQIENLHKKLGGSPPSKKIDTGKTQQQAWISQEQADVLKMIKDFPKYGNPNAHVQIPSAQQTMTQFLPGNDIQFYQNLYKQKSEKLNDQKIITMGLPTTTKSDIMQNKINQLRDKIFNDQNAYQSEQLEVKQPFAQNPSIQDTANIQDQQLIRDQVNSQNVLISKIEPYQNQVFQGNQNKPASDPHHFSSNINHGSAISIEHNEQQEQPTDIVSLVNHHGGDFDSLLQELEKLQQLTKSQENVILDLNNQQVQLQIQLQDKNEENQRLQDQVTQLQSQLENNQHPGSQHISASLRRSQDVEQLKWENEQLKQQLDGIMQTYKDIETDIEKTQGIVEENQNLQKQLQQKDDSIHELQIQLVEKENIIKQNEEQLAKSSTLHLSNTHQQNSEENSKQIKEYQNEINKLQYSIANHTEISEKLNHTIEMQNTQIQQMQEQISTLTQNISEYQTQIQSLQQVQIPQEQGVFMEKLNAMQELMDFFKSQAHLFQPKKIKLNIQDSPSLQKLRQSSRFEMQQKQSE